MNGQNGKNPNPEVVLPGPKGVEITKKVVKHATITQAKSAIHDGVIPLFAIVNRNPSAEASKLLTDYWAWSERAHKYLGDIEKINNNQHEDPSDQSESSS